MCTNTRTTHPDPLADSDEVLKVPGVGEAELSDLSLGPHLLLHPVEKWTGHALTEERRERRRRRRENNQISVFLTDYVQTFLYSKRWRQSSFLFLDFETFGWMHVCSRLAMMHILNKQTNQQNEHKAKRFHVKLTWCHCTLISSSLEQSELSACVSLWRRRSLDSSP